MDTGGVPGGDAPRGAACRGPPSPPAQPPALLREPPAAHGGCQAWRQAQQLFGYRRHKV